MQKTLLQLVLEELEKNRGKWRDVARGSRVPYDTLTKIAQGQIKNPGVLTIQQLAEYFGIVAMTAEVAARVHQPELFQAS